MVKVISTLLVAATLAVASFTTAAPVKKANATAEPKVKAASSDFSGKATWFTDSYGSCNYHWNGYTENIVALNAHQMGPQSWGNPECNRRVHIKNKANGKTVNARIVDKCPGDECAYGSLDLSPKAFETIGDLDTGILDIEWYYI
ncbi:hypothetical protein BGZ97_005787 [Linnemannia gamsii]|uniref:RlpA-like protein double-psi beta-barrel domain-containing protein n=1 Tax=Linnemannia gamsii TaxID=64522 RepID=A0A9P6QU17_9FUNG|nr:hypothetical protein BGZ97_005787 [Linnemannia gamsii]